MSHSGEGMLMGEVCKGLSTARLLDPEALCHRKRRDLVAEQG